MQPSDIKYIYEGYAKDVTKKPIVLDIGSVIIKNKIISSYKSFIKDNNDHKLNTAHLQIDGPARI